MLSSISGRNKKWKKLLSSANCTTEVVFSHFTVFKCLKSRKNKVLRFFVDVSGTVLCFMVNYHDSN